MSILTSLPVHVLMELARNPRAAANALRAWRELATGRRQCSTDPIMLQLEVTARCNFGCRYCIVHNGFAEPNASVAANKADTKDMSLETFRRILDRFPRTFYLQLQGQGEPLLLGDRLAEMIATAHAGKRFSLVVSNGSLWTERRARQLLEAGLSAVAFSLDLCAPARLRINRVIDAARSVPMDVEAVEANLQALIKLRDRLRAPTSIGVSAVLLPDEPRSSVHEAVARLDAFGIDFLMVGPLSGTRAYQDSYPGDMKLHASRTGANWGEVLPDSTRCRVYRTPNANVMHGRCIWPWSALYVNHDGTLSFCANNHRERLPVSALAADARNVHLEARDAFARGTLPGSCGGCQYLAAQPSPLRLLAAPPSTVSPPVY